MFLPVSLRVPLRINALRLLTCITLAVGLGPTRLAAEVPAITALFPAGVQAGQSVTVKVHGSAGTAPVEIWTDRNDLSVKATEKPDEFIVTTTPETQPGVAGLRWHNAEGASDLRPFLIGILPELNEVEPNNATKVAQPISPLPVTINGALDKSGDLDTFAVTLKTGETLVASVEANRSLPSPMDGVIQLVDAQGFVIAQNEDTLGSDPLLAWTAPSDGTWLVRVFAFPIAPDSTIQYYGSPNSIYRLTLTTGPFVERLSPLVQQPGEFTAGGWNLSGEKLQVTGEMGTLRLAPLTSGVVAFTPFAIHQLPEPMGTVVVEDAAAAQQVVTIPASITGAIDHAGDVDTYRFTGMTGRVLRLRTHSRELGSLLDSVVRIRNAAGQMLTEQDDAGQAPDPDFAYTIPADGEYSVEVADRFSSGSERHFYALTICPETPDFTLTLAANRFTLDRTKPLEIPVTINRVAGLNTAIQFTVEGLLPGVTLEPIESKPEGDTAKAVTLKLSVAADTPGGRGPIRLIGQTTGPDLKRSGQSPMEGVKSTTDQLWITLPAK